MQPVSHSNFHQVEADKKLESEMVAAGCQMKRISMEKKKFLIPKLTNWTNPPELKYLIKR